MEVFFRFGKSYSEEFDRSSRNIFLIKKLLITNQGLSQKGAKRKNLN